MNPHQNSKLSQRQQEQAQSQAQFKKGGASGTAAAEFATPEEALRYDAAQVSLPPAIAERLATSIRKEPPPPPKSWWKRIFGG